ncbi:CD1247 N-terminal domain-containing protein [Desulfurispora thermophila]|uniref:CD1247 N-terminal domain-containing protein n=1 Tax=Desulfurispora thermophila TaxID=265470 RepID=UPI00037D7A05|nr:CD1247 N-terminal domain-containing protein [Desulfurispora thermophila]
MQELKSRVAYLKGLAEGVKLDTSTDQGRLISGIIDVLDEFANSFNDLAEAHEQLEDYLETIDQDLYHLEDKVDDQLDNGVGTCDYLEVDCPNCGETVCFSAEVVDDDDIVEVTCPNCDQVVFVNDADLMAADEPEMLEGAMGKRAGEEEDI